MAHVQMNTDTIYWIYLRKTKHCMHANADDARPRSSKKRRVEIFNQLLEQGFKGDALEKMTRSWSMAKRFSVVRLAKVSDMDSTFNPTAVGATRACEGGLKRQQVGLLCGASSIRRRQKRVHDLAASLGWSWKENGLSGKGWCWDTDEEGAFEKGVHLPVKMVYHDAKANGVTDGDSLIVALTGDAARVSQRGTVITTCGAKEADRRLPSQMGTGKTMNQSRRLCTPMLAGSTSATGAGAAGGAPSPMCTLLALGCTVACSDSLFCPFPFG
jgi:hypothetical protein